MSMYLCVCSHECRSLQRSEVLDLLVVSCLKWVLGTEFRSPIKAVDALNL